MAGTKLKQEESDDETQDAKVKISNTYVCAFGISRESIKFYCIKLSFKLRSIVSCYTNESWTG